MKKFILLDNNLEFRVSNQYRVKKVIIIFVFVNLNYDVVAYLINKYLLF